jgi:signal transduction histidine kinase
VTRIESNTLKLKKEQFDLNEKIRNAINDASHVLDDSNNAIKILFDPEPKKYVEDKQCTTIEADKLRIYQVIFNLLSNAIKFTDKVAGNSISIAAMNDEENNQVIVSVKDTGQGIDPEILQKLFTKFATKSHTGTGLGLFISKSIVEAHGGRIWAENNKDGKRGATFYFSLPLIKNREQQNLEKDHDARSQ